jgi:hypothetical protein
MSNNIGSLRGTGHTSAWNWKTAYSHWLSMALLIIATVISLMTVMMQDTLFPGENEGLIAQDVGTNLLNLVLVIPLLGLSLVLVRRGSIKARLMWIGLLAYLAYTFLSEVMIYSFNRMFLLYAVALALSVYALALNLMGFDMSSLDVRGVRPMGRKVTLAIALLTGMILLLWVPEIITANLDGAAPARVTDDGLHTHVIAAMDLGLLFPLGILTCILLVRGRREGFVLAPIMLIKGLTLAGAILAMIAAMTVAGNPPAAGEVVIFAAMFCILGIVTWRYLDGLSSTKGRRTETSDPDGGVADSNNRRHLALARR